MTLIVKVLDPGKARFPRFFLDPSKVKKLECLKNGPAKPYLWIILYSNSIPVITLYYVYSLVPAAVDTCTVAAVLLVTTPQSAE